ncbi:carbon storage regulator CsrA [Bacillaceae bacterium SIJ1]|uniref:carbon storage regulator CsrA n=1 Tax=Litoribacterium kuwaitense TaxID=1398745 RepID=UPI0013EA9413|nr:carbon storage regulator CsrA [Litoribacterium kuwaitense]NGP44936.1 carbon storage regulator CsrA [Litoribacterium kuwaitense]
MLVLTRKLHEAIQIGDDIEVKIVSIDGDQIKLGINAPKHIDIHRREVYVNIQEENTEAVSAPAHLIEALKHSSS